MGGRQSRSFGNFSIASTIPAILTFNSVIDGSLIACYTTVERERSIGTRVKPAGAPSGGRLDEASAKAVAVGVGDMDVADTTALPMWVQLGDACSQPARKFLH